MSLNDFEIIKPLGKGAFASVVQVKRKKDGNIYAMKRVNFGTMNSKERDNALNDVRILASVQHNNIIGYMESFYDDNSKTLNIIMDFADNGDLDSVIKLHVKNRTNVPENDIWNYLIGTLQGLKALHNAKIMHRDLKSANIFLKKNVIKIGDLNVSKLIKRTGMDHTQTGTPYYASPEVWGDKPYDYKCDIWSVGCIIYELCALKPPFRAVSLEDLFKAITKGKYDPIPNHYSSDLTNIIAQMLQVNPSMRPDVAKLLSTPVILKKMDYSVVETNNNNVGANLLQTIKVPKNMKEINLQLPKKKNYDIGEVIIERKNSEENLKPKILDNRSNNMQNNNLNNLIMNNNNKGRDMINPTNIINRIPPDNRSQLVDNRVAQDNNKIMDNKSNINNINKNVGPTINRPSNILNNNNNNDIRRSNDYNQAIINNYNINSNNNNNNNNNPGLIMNKNPSNNSNQPTNNNVKELNRLQDQRAELIKKYQTPNLNDKMQQDIRVRPRTPDAIPKSNVIMKDNRVQQQPVNLGINRNVNVVNPSNIINRNNVPLNNPYIIKRNGTPDKNRPSSNIPVKKEDNKIVIPQNKVLMERNKYMNVMNKVPESNNKVGLIGGSGVGGGINRPASGIYKPMRPVTPDKPKDMYMRPVTPDKQRDMNMRPSNAPNVNYGMGGNRPIMQNNPILRDRPRTPDVMNDRKQVIIRKK